VSKKLPFNSSFNPIIAQKTPISKVSTSTIPTSPKLRSDIILKPEITVEVLPPSTSVRPIIMASPIYDVPKPISGVITKPNYPIYDVPKPNPSFVVKKPIIHTLPFQPISQKPPIAIKPKISNTDSEKSITILKSTTTANQRAAIVNVETSSTNPIKTSTNANVMNVIKPIIHNNKNSTVMTSPLKLENEILKIQPNKIITTTLKPTPTKPTNIITLKTTSTSEKPTETTTKLTLIKKINTNTVTATRPTTTPETTTKIMETTVKPTIKTSIIDRKQFTMPTIIEQPTTSPKPFNAITQNITKRPQMSSWPQQKIKNDNQLELIDRQNTKLSFNTLQNPINTNIIDKFEHIISQTSQQRNNKQDANDANTRNSTIPNRKRPLTITTPSSQTPKPLISFSYLPFPPENVVQYLPEHPIEQKRQMPSKDRESHPERFVETKTNNLPPRNIANRQHDIDPEYNYYITPKTQHRFDIARPTVVSIFPP